MSGSQSPDEPPVRFPDGALDSEPAKSTTGTTAQQEPDEVDSQAPVRDAATDPTQWFRPTDQPTRRLDSEYPAELLGAQQPPGALPPPVLAPPNPSTRSGAYSAARWFHGTTALVAWATLTLQFVLAVANESTAGGLSSAIINYFSSFAILANIVVALVVSALAVNPIRQTSSFAPMRLDSLLMITMSALIYFIVLTPRVNPQGWQAVANFGLHYAVPLLTLVGYGVFGPRPRLSFRDLLSALLVPVIWVIYTLLHGILTDWYPYGFVDVEALGYNGVAVNLGWMLVVTLLLAVGSILLDKKLPWAPRR